MRKTKLLGGFLLIAFVVILVALLYIPKLENVKEKELLSNVYREISSLKKEMGEVEKRQRIAGLEEMIDVVEKDDRASEDSPELTSVQKIEMDEMETQRQVDKLDYYLSHEKPDPSWSEATEDMTIDNFEVGDFAGAKINYVKCGNTFCGAELEIPLDEDRESTIMKMMMTEPWNTHGKIRVLKNGIVKIYFGREGYQIPDVRSVK